MVKPSKTRKSRRKSARGLLKSKRRAYSGGSVSQLQQRNTWTAILATKFGLISSAMKSSAYKNAYASALYMNSDTFESLFHDYKVIAGGGEAVVYQAISGFAIPKAGLISGQPVALRCSLARPEYEDGMDVHQGLRLKSVCGYGITDFLPTTFAVVRTNVPRTSQMARVAEQYNHLHFNWDPSGEAYATTRDPENTPVYKILYQIMDKVDTELGIWLETNLMTDCLVFEYCVGVWAIRKYLGSDIADIKLRNIGLKMVSVPRCYHLGNESYVFGPGPMPIRLDIPGNMYKINDQSDINLNVFNLNLDKDKFASNEAFQICQSNKSKGIFELFHQYFSKYQIAAPGGARQEYHVFPRADVSV